MIYEEKAVVLGLVVMALLWITRGGFKENTGILSSTLHYDDLKDTVKDGDNSLGIMLEMGQSQ